MVSPDYENQIEEATYDFSTALYELKIWHRLSRKWWNSKEIYIYYVPDNIYPAQTEIAKEAFPYWVPYHAYIAFKTSENYIVPWTASQVDILATDWFII